MGASAGAQRWRMALETLEGPGALKGLVWVNVFTTLSTANALNSGDGDLGGLGSLNWCSLVPEEHSGGGGDLIQHILLSPRLLLSLSHRVS